MSGEGAPERIRRILVSNVYSWQNKGDAAIVVCMLEDLRRQFPEAEITLSSVDREDAGRYGDFAVTPGFSTRYAECFGSPESVGGRLAYGARFLLFRARLGLFRRLLRLGVRAYALFPAPIGGKIREYEGFDLVVACGGGYITTRAPHRKIETLFGCYGVVIFCYDFFLADLFGKPYVLYHQSVGPFARPRDFSLMRTFLERARVIVCREPLSAARLREYGLRNVAEGADVAFRLPDAETAVLDRYGFRPGATNIGVTVRSWLDAPAQARFEEEFAGFLEEQLAGDPAAAVYFMPQVVYSAGRDDDRVVARRVAARLGARFAGRVHVVEEDLHPAMLKHAIGRMSCMVGTRMHSNIFALSSGVPTLAIAYEPKTEGIMRMLGLERYVLPMREVTRERLGGLLRELRADAGYGAALERGLREVRERGTVALADYLGRRPAPGLCA